MFHRRSILLLLVILVPSCSKSSGDTTIINQDVVPAPPVTRTWRIPELISVFNAGSSQQPEVLFDSAGNALALFVEQGIWSRRWTPGQGWEDLDRVSDPASPYGGSPKLAMDGAGNAIAVFDDLDDPSALDRSVWWNQYAVGIGWGTAQLLETDDVTSAAGVEIAMDPSGNALAIWQTYDSIQSDVWFSRYVVGLDWTVPAPLDDGPESSAGVKVGMDASGNAIAVWSRYDGTSQIVTARYVPGPGWSPTEPLELGGEQAFSPELAVNAAGRAIALWTQSDGGVLMDLWSRTYDPATGWGTPTLVESDDTASMTFSQVVIDADGGGTAVWNTDTNDLWSARYLPGSGWTPVELVAPLMMGLSPRLAISASGTTGVVWSHYDGNSTNILFSSHTGGPWTPPEFVEFNEAFADQPALAMDTNGNAMALWVYYYDNGVGFRTWANWYE